MAEPREAALESQPVDSSWEKNLKPIKELVIEMGVDLK